MSSRNRTRFSLLTVMLLVSAVATWTARFRTINDTKRLNQVLPAMRVFARELVVRDENEIAAILKPITWPENCYWDIHVPGEKKYSLQLAIDPITSNENLGVVEIVLPPGRHQVWLKVDCIDPCFDLLLDGVSVGTISVPKDLADYMHYSPHDPGESTTTQQTTKQRQSLVLLKEGVSAIREKPERNKTPLMLVLSVEPFEKSRRSEKD